MGRKQIIDDETLLAHARVVFMEKGAFGSTKDIAKLAGISEAAIFKRFPTKAKLFLAAMLPPDVETEKIIAVEIEDTQEALIETGYRMLAHFRNVIPTAMHLMTHPTIKMSDVAAHFKSGSGADIGQHLEKFLLDRETQGQLKIDNARGAAGLLVAAIHSLAVYELMEFHDGEDLEHAVPHFVSALWSGLSPPENSNDP